MFYTYIHKKLDTGEVFYVGKGHGARHVSSHNRNRYWNNTVNKHGFEAVIVERYDSERDALDAEIQLIAKMRSEGVKLVNITDGGEGVSGLKHTEESRALMSEKLRGREFTEEHKAKIGVASTGRPKSIEEIESSRINRIGAKRTEEQRRRISDGIGDSRKGEKHPMFGRKHSEASKAKMRAARLGKKPWNAGLKGAYFQTDETKEKVREAVRLSWKKTKNGE